MTNIFQDTKGSENMSERIKPFVIRLINNVNFEIEMLKTIKTVTNNDFNDEIIDKNEYEREVQEIDKAIDGLKSAIDCLKNLNESD